jgi:hypothetical protein
MPILDAIKDKHSTIAYLFGSGLGHRFQRVDSNIAAVICHMFARTGVTVLPVHDSFIVPAGQEQNLRRCMQGLYANVWHSFDIEPRDGWLELTEALYAHAAPDIKAK